MVEHVAHSWKNYMFLKGLWLLPIQTNALNRSDNRDHSAPVYLYPDIRPSKTGFVSRFFVTLFFRILIWVSFFHLKLEFSQLRSKVTFSRTRTNHGTYIIWSLRICRARVKERYFMKSFWLVSIRFLAILPWKGKRPRPLPEIPRGSLLHGTYIRL